MYTSNIQRGGSAEQRLHGVGVRRRRRARRLLSVQDDELQRRRARPRLAGARPRAARRAARARRATPRRLHTLTPAAPIQAQRDA